MKNSFKVDSNCFAQHKWRMDAFRFHVILILNFFNQKSDIIYDFRFQGFYIIIFTEKLSLKILENLFFI